jgi:hypothetical protein
MGYQCNICRVEARYRLAWMREVRTRDARVRRGELAAQADDERELAAQAGAAAHRVALAAAAIAAATAARDRLLGRGASAAAIALAERHVQRLRHTLDAERDALARAEARHAGQLDAVAAARARLAAARADREVIERHFAAWRARRKKRAERRAE